MGNVVKGELDIYIINPLFQKRCLIFSLIVTISCINFLACGLHTLWKWWNPRYPPPSPPSWAMWRTQAILLRRMIENIDFRTPHSTPPSMWRTQALLSDERSIGGPSSLPYFQWHLRPLMLPFYRIHIQCPTHAMSKVSGFGIEFGGFLAIMYACPFTWVVRLHTSFHVLSL